MSDWHTATLLGLAVAVAPVLTAWAAVRWQRGRRWYLRAPQGVTVGPFRSKQAAEKYRARQELHLDGYMPARIRPPKR